MAPFQQIHALHLSYPSCTLQELSPHIKGWLIHHLSQFHLLQPPGASFFFPLFHQYLILSSAPTLWGSCLLVENYFMWSGLLTIFYVAFFSNSWDEWSMLTFLRDIPQSGEKYDIWHLFVLPGESDHWGFSSIFPTKSWDLFSFLSPLNLPGHLTWITATSHF